MSLIANLIRSFTPKRMRPIGYLTDLARRKTNLCVNSGPFKGMLYIGTAFCSAYIPKLIGTYERELTNIVEEICARMPPLIVDVGAAEGYYAIGFATRLADTHV